MKNSLMNQYDKMLLWKRTLVETVNDELKNVCNSIQDTALLTTSHQI